MKKYLAVLLGTASLLATGVAAAPAASAATSCYASSCNGLNPETTICQNDARTVGSGAFGAMELRYSPTCRAAWGRFAFSAPAGSEIVIKNTNGRNYTKKGSGHFWSQMVNDKDITAWACGYWTTNNFRNTECTDAY